MNYLEHRIKEVLSVEKVTHRRLGGRLVKVKLVSDIQGSERLETKVFGANEWEKIKKRGYFLEQEKSNGEIFN